MPFSCFSRRESVSVRWFRAFARRTCVVSTSNFVALPALNFLSAMRRASSRAEISSRATSVELRRSRTP